MFLLYINDIGEGISSEIKLFADDCLLYREVNSVEDALVLQSDLDQLSTWRRHWQMNFNPVKCYTLRVSRLSLLHVHNYHIAGNMLRSVSDHPYLGVHRSNDLSWNIHIAKICKKATNQLNFIKRNVSKCTSEVKSLAYSTLVRPHLEYASTVWDPHTKKNITEIESVQRRAARFVNNCYDRHSSVTDLVKQLGWDTLEVRRKANRLTTFYKSVHGKIALPLPDGLLKPTRITRNKHSKSYLEMPTGPNYFTESFYPRTVRDWNALPEEVVQAVSAEAFKKRVLDHLNND